MNSTSEVVVDLNTDGYFSLWVNPSIQIFVNFHTDRWSALAVQIHEQRVARLIIGNRNLPGINALTRRNSGMVSKDWELL